MKLKLVVLVLASGCGWLSPNLADKEQESGEGVVDNSSPSSNDGAPPAADLRVPNAEDAEPLAGLDAETLLAMPLNTAPNRPCGLRRPVEKELLNRFGWDDEGRLTIFDYVFLSTDEWELESRNVRFYDDEGRLTDDVYVEGTQGEIHHRLWYQWEDDKPVRRYIDDDNRSQGVAGPIAITPETWTLADYVFSYDAASLTLQVQRTHGGPFIEYELAEAVDPGEVVVAHGVFDSFRLMGPIVAAHEVYGTHNDLTGEGSQNREAIVYERDDQGRTTLVADDELIYDCTMYE